MCRMLEIVSYTVDADDHESMVSDLTRAGDWKHERTVGHLYIG